MRFTPENNQLPAAPVAAKTREGLNLSIGIGNCAVTGYPGLVVFLPLGDASLRVVDEEATTIEDGKVKFAYKDEPFEALVSISPEGLVLLAETLEGNLTIPITPGEIVYFWRAMFADGSVVSEFEVDVEGNTVERKWSEVVEPLFGEVAQISLLPINDPLLPTYTFNRTEGTFWRNGEQIFPGYGGEYDPAKATPWRCRKVTQTLASACEGGALHRTTSKKLDSVNYWLGWREGWLDVPGVRACMISIDHHGNWRLVECSE